MNSQRLARSRRALCGLVALLVLTPSVAFAASTGKANDRANIRKTASTDAESMGIVRVGDTVRIEGTKGDWYKVTFDGVTGYVKKEFIDEGASGSGSSGSSASSASGTAKTTDKVNLRKSASTDAESLAQISTGTTVTLVEKSGDWYKVKVDGKTGYIRSDLLDRSGSSSSGSSGSSGSSSEGKAAKTTEQVNLRKKASTDSTSLMLVDGGKTVSVVGTDGEWSKVTYDGTTGYIRSDFLTTNAASTGASGASGTSDAATPTPPAVVGLQMGSNGSKVKTLQEALYIQGYYEGNKDGIFGEDTRRAVMQFQSDAGLTIDGVATTAVTDALYLAAEMTKAAAAQVEEAVVAAQPTEATSGVTNAAATSGSVQKLSWSDVKSIIPKHEPLQVLDLGTGKTYTLSCFSAGNHADVEPMTKDDTATLKSIYGSWSWDPRPVWVTWGGKTYAAAINGMPHGSGTIEGNGMSGQICLHFKGSTTHNGNKSYEKTFQNVIQQAWDAAK